MKIIVFENDQDFEEFAIVPQLRVIVDGDREYYDWYFTPEYNAEVMNGTMFFIKDKKSKILRRNACTYNIISKPVKNVKSYNPLFAKANSSKIQIIDYKNYYIQQEDETEKN